MKNKSAQIILVIFMKMWPCTVKCTHIRERRSWWMNRWIWIIDELSLKTVTLLFSISPDFSTVFFSSTQQLTLFSFPKCSHLIDSSKIISSLHFIGFVNVCESIMRFRGICEVYGCLWDFYSFLFFLWFLEISGISWDFLGFLGIFGIFGISRDS